MLSWGFLTFLFVIYGWQGVIRNRGLSVFWASGYSWNRRPMKATQGRWVSVFFRMAPNDELNFGKYSIPKGPNRFDLVLSADGAVTPWTTRQSNKFKFEMISGLITYLPSPAGTKSSLPCCKSNNQLKRNKCLMIHGSPRTEKTTEVRHTRLFRIKSKF